MDRRLIFLLNVAQRRVQRFVATQAPKGVTATQAGLLFVLGRRDGVLLGDLEELSRLVIAPAAESITLLHPLGHDYFRLLRSKLHWGRSGRTGGAEY